MIDLRLYSEPRCVVRDYKLSARNSRRFVEMRMLRTQSKNQIFEIHISNVKLLFMTNYRR